MIYGSVCSGIEAATVAWHPLGWRASFFSEIERFPRAVLRHHYPDTPLHGDFTTIQEGQYAAINLLVGGTPCQSFSMAGLRKGFADERGNLTLEFVRLAQRLQPAWVVWENVTGVLSLERGRAFASLLGGLAKCGYGFAYRVLDAQYFGVPQRRQRVFVVAYLGDWRPPAAVLFERESLLRDIAPRRETAQAAAAAAGAGAFAAGAGIEPIPINSQAMRGSGGGEWRNDDGYGNGLGVGHPGEPANTLLRSERHALAHWCPARGRMVARYFTPREAERLQGFADDYTRIPWRGGFAADAPRYQVLGNSMHTGTMRWIGQRISMVQSLL